MLSSGSILIIIDMQADFDAALSESLQQSIISEISRAKENQDKIIVIGYKRHGHILSAIRRATKGYSNVLYRRKRKDDGAKVIYNCIGAQDSHLKICGVNTGGCVLKTVTSLSSMLDNVKISVIKEACASKSGARTHLNAIKKMSKLDNVTII